MTGTDRAAVVQSAPPLQFLPVNRPGSPPELKRRRAYQSCEPCRKRKSRCVPETEDRRWPCRRCVADGQSERCEFSDTRNTRRRLSRTPAAAAAALSPVSPPVDGRHRYSPIRGANSAGHGSNALFGAARDSDQATPMQRLPVPLSGTIGPRMPSTSPGRPSPSTNANYPTARSRIMAARLHNTADALDLLTFTAAGNDATPSVVAASDALLGLRDPVETDCSWERFVLIRKGVVTKTEVCEYLHFYFNVMWSLRPVVHPFYRDRSRYSLLAIDEPLLLISLVTLSSRYHSLSGSHGDIRSERIHWQAWKFLRKYLQSALWGSPYTRSPGAIAAMLLMIEWHSKAINNPASFSEEEDGDTLSSPQRPRQESFGTRPGQITSLTSQQRYGMATLLESLNIVAPAYRSNKMSWMLLSNAIALAHEGCCFDSLDAQSSGGSPASSEQEGFRQQWNQLICVFLYLADENVAMRLGLNPLLSQQSTEVVRNRYSTTFASILPNTALWESYYDLSAETRKAGLLLQSLKQGGLTLANVNLLPELQHIERALGRWRRQHAACFNSSPAELLRTCLDLEYHYALMYSFAPASYALQHHNSTATSETDKTDQHLALKVAALTRLADQATGASYQMLSIIVNLGPSNLLRYLPVRCWVFIVAANLHLLKSDPNIQLLRASIIAIRSASPDDTHMAIRYSRFLEILLNASMRSSSSSSAESPVGTGVGTGVGVEQQQPEVGGAAGAGLATEEMDWWSRYSMMVSGSGLDSVAALNLNFHLPGGLAPQIGRDPFQWWDGAFGMTGAVGFP
ncbi:hypothetical protein C8A00DRAFT_46358 [Chaetomidium leptoderma]|uniref:Zn(2)-C6 fungal-type domain-containing protein n=1 Tax=Chaetomidium leptoderma TaxID=669021 RepID=A0AAN6ZU60_9PEZI|nr:hypothetical protein C8A00DRAFT_46358 [Chaetomidium leptoderma]